MDKGNMIQGGCIFPYMEVFHIWLEIGVNKNNQSR